MRGDTSLWAKLHFLIHDGACFLGPIWGGGGVLLVVLGGQIWGVLGCFGPFWAVLGRFGSIWGQIWSFS